MPYATTAKLGAGTKFACDLLDDGAYVQIPGLKTLPEVGEKGSFAETTPLDVTTKTFIGGLKEGAEQAFQFNDVPGDADLMAFLALMNGSLNVKVQVTFTTGRIGQFELAPGGWAVDPPEPEGAVTVTAAGKQSGAVAWSATA